MEKPKTKINIMLIEKLQKHLHCHHIRGGEVVLFVQIKIIEETCFIYSKLGKYDKQIKHMKIKE